MVYFEVNSRFVKPYVKPRTNYIQSNKERGSRKEERGKISLCVGRLCLCFRTPPSLKDEGVIINIGSIPAEVNVKQLKIFEKRDNSKTQISNS